MSKVRKLNICLVFAVCLLCVLLCGTSMADGGQKVSYTETPIYIDGLLSCRGYCVGGTTYLPLETTCAVLGYNFETDRNLETNTLTVGIDNIDIRLCADEKYMSANGRYFYLPDGYIEIEGSAVVPIDVMAKIFTLEAVWSEELEAYNLDSANEAILLSADEFYNSTDLYWLSRIITYEAGNQPLEGMIGVGNVVMNRVASSRFPNTVKSVIFQQGQFSPVESGAIYLEPFDIGMIAAKMVLEGSNTVDDALFFQKGMSGDYWIKNNTVLVASIGDHNFMAIDGY